MDCFDDLISVCHEKSDHGGKVEMDMPSSTKRAFQFLIKGMCQKCQLKSCMECLYLEDAFNGETDAIINYIAIMAKVKQK